VFITKEYVTVFGLESETLTVKLAVLYELVSVGVIELMLGKLITPYVAVVIPGFIVKDGVVIVVPADIMKFDE
jgi:hypothetical protein